MKNWFISSKGIWKYRGNYWLIPCVSLRYHKYHFLETGVETPAFIIEINFLIYEWGITIQKGY